MGAKNLLEYAWSLICLVFLNGNTFQVKIVAFFNIFKILCLILSFAFSNIALSMKKIILFFSIFLNLTSETK